MELLDATLSKLNINTAEIKIEDLQNVLLTLKKISGSMENFSAHYDRILEKLWLHLTNGFQELDDQLLCSISFYTLLSKSKNQEWYLLEVLQIVNHELKLKNDITKGSRISLAISLSYGIFQSSYLLQQSGSNETLEKMLNAIFQLLIQKAYEYTQYTFIVFKIMTSFKKVAGIGLQNILFTINNQIKLLHLINNNWENPITGVRNLNRIIFQNLLMVLNENVFETVLDEIKSFYWNKAKYLMLAEIIEHSKEKIEDMVAEYGCLDGLISSLSKPGLVSAGTDMYNAILKKINSAETWTRVFLVNVTEILSGSCFKAIENFSNYWCLNTLKKFPSLMQAIINAINNINKAEYKLYSTICVMKHGNKLGLIQKTTSNCCYELKEKLVLSSLEYSEPTIRMLAFEIICVSQQNCLPSVIEYNQILKFLYNNVNSDCTVLRISMINNLSFFLTKLHTSFINTTQICSNEDIQLLNGFCEELQHFVIKSLDFNGNYQRKITTIKIAYTVLQCLNEVPRKKHKQIRESKKSLMSFLKENSHWKLNTNNFIMKLFNLLKDPANDVHEGVLQILTEFYTAELSETSIINYLIEEGLKCISSKFFYEISCGQIIFKLIANILIKNNVDSKFKSLEDIFYFAYNELNLEHCNKSDILKLIEDGKQSHSFLSILSIILDTSIKNYYPINIPKKIIFSLLDIVEHISNQFVWEEDLSNCSDYSKMNDMIQTIIKNSGLESQNEDDHTKISGLHQIVLNCLWLNVKASCELGSLLIRYYKQDIIISEKCLNIITHVLETSRHKGVIEAAGATLGSSIQFLTSLAEEPDISKLPFTLLKTKLNELLFEGDKMSSVTRRGAGLSIMIHRIVSNDCNKGKPLFHYFIKILLNTCKSLDDYHKYEDMKDIDNDKDIPKAIHIHFLTRIVTDSSLATDMMYYSAELAALAFDNLTNNHWQIRNAALQLYGALVPKLIGQKKLSGTDEETIATVACDEFRTHCPDLWNYIIYQITKEKHEDIIQAHSNLVPILNVLASFAKRYNFPDDLEQNSDLDLTHLFHLLGSPIYTVRRLTAQCITNIYLFDHIYQALDNNKCYTENYLHGTLMLISDCCKTYCYTKNITHLQSLIRKYQNIVLQRNHSYLCKWNLERLFQIPEKVTIERFNNILLEVNDNRYKLGVSLWANLKIQNSLENMPWSMIPEILEKLIKSNEFKKYGEAIVNKIKNDIEPSEKDLHKVAQILLASDMVTKSSTLWKVLYYISLKIDIDLHLLDMSLLHAYTEHMTYNLRYIIPFAARLLKNQINNENLLLLSKSIFSICNPGRNDVDMRYIAVLANNEFGDELCKYSDEVKINAIKSTIILLQDEDEDIRNLSIKFYETVMKESKHPSICLNNILNKKFLCKVLHDPVSSIQSICDGLLSFIDSISVSKDNDYNPFSNDSKNIYLETNLFQLILQDLRNTL